MASTTVPPQTPTASPAATAHVREGDESVVATRAPLPASAPRTMPRRIAAADFANPDADLRLAYPCAFDSTVSTGLGALQKALPGWADALVRGRLSLPTPTASTPLLELLRWGTAACSPVAAGGLRAATKRRRSLAQFVGLADARPLASITANDVVALEAAYRVSRARRPGAQVSADLTELRHLLEEARGAAGLPPLGLPAGHEARVRDSPLSRSPWPASGARQPSRARPVARLGDVHEAMRTALTMQRPRKRGGPPLQTRWLAACLALQLAVPLTPARILGLRRSNIAGDRIVIPATATTRAERYGLPEWASDALDAALPGWSSLAPDALLFKGRRGKPRTDLARVLEIVTQAGASGDGSGDDAGHDAAVTSLAQLTPSAVRRLGQTIHRGMGGPRGVVRGSMGAPSSVGTEFDKYFASEEHAANVVRGWRRMLEPPGGEGRTLPARARAGCAPGKPEFDPLRTAEPARAMPESCEARPRPDQGPTSNVGAGAGLGAAKLSSVGGAGGSTSNAVAGAALRSPAPDGGGRGPAASARPIGTPERRDDVGAATSRTQRDSRNAATSTPRPPVTPAAPALLRSLPASPGAGPRVRAAPSAEIVAPARVPNTARAAPSGPLPTSSQSRASQQAPQFGAPRLRPEQAPKTKDLRPPPGPSRDPGAKPSLPIAGEPARQGTRRPSAGPKSLPTLGTRPPAATPRARVDTEEWPGDEDLRDRRRRGGR